MRLSYLVCLSLLGHACSKKDETTTAAVEESIAEVATALTKAYPGSLSISVVPYLNLDGSDG